MLICDRTHNTSNCQAVKIIINKDQDSKHDRCKLCPNSCLDVNTSPTPKCCRTSCIIHHADHNSKNNQEYQDSHIIAICQYSYDSIFKYMQYCLFKMEIRPEDSSDRNSDKQGTIHFFRDQCKTNCHNWGYQCPE